MVEIEFADGLPDHAEARCICRLSQDGEADASCSLWWSGTPGYRDRRVGLVGHFQTSGEAAAVELLTDACLHLRERGCQLAIGPMDGNTWRRYRLVTGDGDCVESLPPFFLEPTNPAGWPDHFRAVGFHPLARYFSSFVNGPKSPDPRVSRIATRAESQGFRWGTVHEQSFECVLRRIFSMSVEVFGGNFLYTPQAWEDFAAQYARIGPYVNREFVILCTKDGEDAAFLFAIPDLEQARRGEPVDTLIVKTVGVRPRYQGRGLGSILTQATHQSAWQAGYRRVIHALMHEQNESNEIMAADAVRFREYTLFSKELR